MAKKAFDYSKWDKIELSDDEEDLHPNIDKDSWFRWKHQARIDREEKEKIEKEEIEEKNALAKAQQAEILKKLARLEGGEEDANSKAEEEGLRAELAEIEKGLKERKDRLEEMEKNAKLNVDNIGTVVKDYTFINRREATSDVLPDSFDFSKTNISEQAESSPSTNKVTPPSAADASGKKSAVPTKASTAVTTTSKAATPPSAPGPKSELESVENYNTFAKTHEKLLEDFSEITSMEQTKEVLHEKGHILLAEHAQSYLLLSCLEDEMNGKHARMKNTARQSQILSHISELAASLHRSPRDVVIPFFKRLEAVEHLQGYNDAVKDFIKRIEKRAVEKRKEMDEARQRGEDVDEYEEYEVPEEERLGPGGLDPVKVFQNLPVALQEAFESRDMEKLHKALAALPVEEAQKHMKDCEDSGLWVPSRSSQGSEAEAAAQES